MTEGELKLWPLDIYGGFVPAATMVRTGFCRHKIMPGQVIMPIFERLLPDDMNFIVGWTGYISTFGPAAYDAINKRPTTPGIHTDVWLSLKPLTVPGDKQAAGIFAKFGSGDSGNAVDGKMFPPPYHILVPPGTGRKIYIGTWAHNMRVTTDDFHCGFVLYYL